MQARNELCRRAHAYPLLRRCHGSAANPLSEPALGTRQCSPDYRHFLPAPYAAMPGMAALFTQARSKSSPDPTPTWHLHHGVQRPRAFLGEGGGGAVPPCPHTHTRKKIDVIFVLLGRDAFGWLNQLMSYELGDPDDSDLFFEKDISVVVMKKTYIVLMISLETLAIWNQTLEVWQLVWI